MEQLLERILAQGKKDGKVMSAQLIDCMDKMQMEAEQAELFCQQLEQSHIRIDISDLRPLLLKRHQLMMKSGAAQRQQLEYQVIASENIYSNGYYLFIPCYYFNIYQFNDVYIFL